jgi:hypothetical protein
MKSIELTAYVVREYDAKYTVVLDENDPFIQEILINNDMTFDQLAALDYADYRGLWDTIMSIPTNEIDIQEDFAQGDERFVDFEAYISESA